MKKVSFVGAGAMAEAIIAGIVEQQVLESKQIYVMNKQNKARLQELEDTYGIKGSQDHDTVLSDADLIVIATKPDDVEGALREMAPYITEEQLLVSVIAGVSTTSIVESVGKEMPVVRTMPNTSAMIGQSATAICKGKFATNTHIQQTEALFEAIGTVSVVAEEQMHIVTGISGSGPAYIYYIVEAMEQAAAEEGLASDVAKQLITQTILGAGKMLQTQPESASQLRENVTSPNGTTAAGIAALERHTVDEAVIDCVKSATRRSEELGQQK